MSLTRTFAFVLFVMLSVTGAALAQELPDIPKIEADEVTTGQIVSFVNAAIAVERVRADYTTRIEEAETEADRNALVTEADKSSMQAVESVIGITPGEYLAIGQAAQGNEELSERINARIAELRDKQLLKSE